MQNRKCHNIEDHASEKSYQDIYMFQKAETEIIKMSNISKGKEIKISKEIKAVNAGNRVSSTSGIHQSYPFLDKDNILRLGGSLVKSNLSHALKHPVLILKYCIISQLIIRYYHEKTHNQEEG